MSKTETRPGRSRKLAELAGALAVLAIPHAILSAKHNLPPGFISLHVGAAAFTGIASLITRHTHIVSQRAETAVKQAYLDGHVEKLSIDLESLEDRVRHN